MSTNLVSATDAILSTLKTAWDAGAPAIVGGPATAPVYEILEPDLKPHPRDSGNSWCRITIRHNDDSKKVSLTDSARRARYRRTGLAWVQVFSPRKGASYYTQLQALATLVGHAFEGKRSAADGVNYTQVAVIDQPPEAAWFRYDVKVAFMWDEIHN